MIDAAALALDYERDGVISPVTLLDPNEVARHRNALEHAERALGPLHYVNKIHTIMRSAYELATLPRVLDVVQGLIGPDILLYSTTYIIKEPGSQAYVAWHQDLTYWGLEDDDAQVSMWLALAPATVEAGCMSMIPASHKRGRVAHVESVDDANVLLRGQHIETVDERAARACPLEPGQASFHHGWTLHNSAPNTTSDRRIGLNVQYVAPHNRQTGVSPSATLVRGEDRHGFYQDEELPTGELDLDRSPALFTAHEAMKERFQSPQST